MKYTLELPGKTVAEDHEAIGQAIMERFATQVQPSPDSLALQGTRYLAGRSASRMFRDYILRTITRHSMAGMHHEQGCPISCFKEGTNGDATYRRAITKLMLKEGEITAITGSRTVRYVATEEASRAAGQRRASTTATNQEEE